MSQVRTLDETIIGLVDHTSRVLACRIVSVVGKSPSEAVQQRDPPEAHQSIMSSRRCRRTFEVREHSLPALFLPLFRRGLVLYRRRGALPIGGSDRKGSGKVEGGWTRRLLFVVDYCVPCLPCSGAWTVFVCLVVASPCLLPCSVALSSRSWSQALVGMLRVMVRCCKHSGVRKRSLITYKAPIILRKIVTLPNDQLEFYGLQLYKVLCRQM